jgi:hypothetical protein
MRVGGCDRVRRVSRFLARDPETWDDEAGNGLVAGAGDRLSSRIGAAEGEFRTMTGQSEMAFLREPPQG